MNKMKALYSLSMPIRNDEDDDQGYADRVRQYDNYNNQNFLHIQQLFAEQQAEINILKSRLGG